MPDQRFKDMTIPETLRALADEIERYDLDWRIRRAVLVLEVRPAATERRFYQTSILKGGAEPTLDDLDRMLAGALVARRHVADDDHPWIAAIHCKET